MQLRQINKTTYMPMYVQYDPRKFFLFLVRRKINASYLNVVRVFSFYGVDLL